MKAKQKIFISYSHKDKECYVDFCTHLDTLKVEFWSDIEILAGGSLDEIFSKLKDSTIFVALVSPDYLYSESCKKELERAFQLKSEGRIIIIPVIIRDCNWKPSFDGILAIPEDGEAITNWDNKDKAFTNVIVEISRLVKSMASDQQHDASEDKVEKINSKLIAESKQDFSNKKNQDTPTIALEYVIDEMNKLPDKKLVVFLGGPDLKNKDKCKKAKLRYDIFKALEEEYDVVPGEYKGFQELQKKTGDDAQQSELKFIKKRCQAIIIIPESPGSFCEFGLFSWHFAYGNMKEKRLVFIALVDEKYKDDESYFNEGPVKSLRVHGQVIRVNYDEEYKKYIEEVKDILSSASSIIRE